MNYVERYIYAVTRYLPEKDREEVGRELRSNLEDMLLEDYSEENIKRVLEDMGSPYELSSRYLDQEKYLLGPRVYPIYMEALKILVIVAVIVGAITFTVDLFFTINAIDTVNSLSDIIGTTVRIITNGIGIMFDVVVGFFFWVTLGFIIVEKTNVLDEMKSPKNKAFVVEDLKEIPKSKGKKISKVEMAFSFVFTIAFLFIFLFRNDLIAVYIAGEGSFAIFNVDTIRSYGVLVMVVGALSLLLTLYKLIAGRWTKKLAIFSAIYAVISLGTTIIIVLDPNLFGQEFLTFMEMNFGDFGSNFLDNMGKLKLGFIAVVLIITIIDMGTALYQGFRKDKTQIGKGF